MIPSTVQRLFLIFGLADNTIVPISVGDLAGGDAVKDHPAFAKCRGIFPWVETARPGDVYYTTSYPAILVSCVLCDAANPPKITCQ